MIPTFTRGYEAAAAIAGFTFVKFAAPGTDNTITTGVAETDAVFGIADRQGAEAGQMCDVHMGGLVSIQLGGAANAGDPLTADANGKAVVASASAATTVRVVGYANEPGVADDIIDMIWAPALLHQA